MIPIRPGPPQQNTNMPLVPGIILSKPNSKLHDPYQTGSAPAEYQYASCARNHFIKAQFGAESSRSDRVRPVPGRTRSDEDFKGIIFVKKLFHLLTIP